ncbi:MAG: PilZ domain-containing protein [Acidobacteriota bacterium]
MPEARPFHFRPYRVEARLALEFTCGGVKLQGVSRDISCNGVRAILNGKLAIGDRGLLMIHSDRKCLELHARVKYIDQGETAFTFSFDSPWERDRVTDLIKRIQRTSSSGNAIRKSPG